MRSRFNIPRRDHDRSMQREASMRYGKRVGNFNQFKFALTRGEATLIILTTSVETLIGIFMPSLPMVGFPKHIERPE
jgi:hypothetical protein